MATGRTKSIEQQVAEFRQTAVGYDHQLRNHLAQIILSNIKRLGIKQVDLARASRKKESYISRLIHSGTRFQSDTAADILHALNEMAKPHGYTVDPVIFNPVRYQLVPIPRAQTNDQTTVIYGKKKEQATTNDTIQISGFAARGSTISAGSTTSP